MKNHQKQTGFEGNHASFTNSNAQQLQRISELKLSVASNAISFYSFIWYKTYTMNAILSNERLSSFFSCSFEQSHTNEKRKPIGIVRHFGVLVDKTCKKTMNTKKERKYKTLTSSTAQHSIGMKFIPSNDLDSQL